MVYTGTIDQEDPLNTSFEPIDLQHCSKDFWHEEFHTHDDEPMHELDLWVDHAFCLPNPAEITVAGGIDRSFWKGVTMKVVRCRGGVDAGCKTEEEIDEFIQSITVFTKFSTEKFNVNVYGKRSDVIETYTTTELIDMPRIGMKKRT